MTHVESRDRGTESLLRRLRADIEFLASPELEGRGTPSRGLDLAALYLETQLRAAGVAPAQGDSYRQVYRMGDYVPSESQVEISIGGRVLEPSDYVFWNISGDPGRSPFTLPLTYAGFGVTAPEKNADQLAGLDLAGQAVVVRRGAPWDLDPTSVFGPDRALGKVVAATVRGARMLVYLSDALDSSEDQESLFFHQMKDATVGFLREQGVDHASALNPILILRPAAFEAAVGRKLERCDSGPLGADLEIKIQASVSEGQAANIIAVVPGTDPKLRDEHILLSAHYDHLGMHENGDGKRIWPGADDNASGVAGVLDIMRRFAARPGRRSVMAFFGSGEERAILGSAYYNFQPLININQIALQINLDMIGRSDGSVQGVADGSPELFSVTAELANAQGVELIPDRQPEWRLVYLTDTYHFVRANTPFIFFFTGFHPDYHQPSDTADKIQYPELGRIVDAAADLARHYADGAEPPPFERPDWFITPPANTEG